MKKVFMFIILCAVLFAAVGNFEIQAQVVDSRYGGSFSASVANQPSPLLNNRTLLEQRDYGVDLFIGGLSTNFVLAPTLGGLAALILLPFTIVTFDIDFVTVIPTAIVTVTSAIGFAIWVAGAVYWGHGNSLLSRGVVISERKHDNPDVVLALDTEINGIGVAIRY